MPRRNFVVAAVALVALLAIGQLLVGSQKKPFSQIVLAENASPLASLTIIAHQKEFFKAEGLDVKVSRFTSGKLALDAVLGGGADLATVAETPIMFAGLAGQDFQIFSTIFLSGNACKVVARADRNIAKPSDLRGKKIATFVGTNAEYFTKKFLENNNLSISDVTIVNLTPTDMVIAFEHGDIDAYVVWEPFIYNGKALLGDRAVVFDSPDLYTTTFNIVARPAFLKEHPNESAAFIRALKRASLFVAEHQPDAIATVANYTNIPPATLEQVWKDYHFPVVLEDTLATYLSEQAKWAIDSGRAKPPAPDYRKYLNSEPLRDAGK